MNLLASLFHKVLGNEIEITLNIDHVSFRYRDRIENLVPIIHVSTGSDDRHILAVGELSILTTPSERFYLFDGAPLQTGSLTKESLLELFFSTRHQDAEAQHCHSKPAPRIS